MTPFTFTSSHGSWVYIDDIIAPQHKYLDKFRAWHKLAAWDRLKDVRGSFPFLSMFSPRAFQVLIPLQSLLSKNILQ